MDLAVFYEVVVPLLEMGDSVLIMISTPVDSFNFYSELMELRDPVSGERVLQVTVRSLPLSSLPPSLSAQGYVEELICPKCKAGPNPTDCRHYLYKIPPWKSAQKLDIVKLILKDNKTTLQRESMGVVTDSGLPLIDKRTLEKFRGAPLYEITALCAPTEIMMTLDPNTASTDGSSEMAVMSVARVNGRLVVRLFSQLLSEEDKRRLIWRERVCCSRCCCWRWRLSAMRCSISSGVGMGGPSPRSSSEQRMSRTQAEIFRVRGYSWLP